MHLVIIEDELAASDHLQFLLKSIDDSIQVVKILDSVSASVDYFSTSPEVDLILMDIHLADGISFEIFDQVNINTPIIFTTAYDHYAIKAFKVNSVDYILKPIDRNELSLAFDKFNNQSKKTNIDQNQMQSILELFKKETKNYKNTYLAHHRDELIPIKTDDIAFFFIDTGIVKGVLFEGKKFILDKKLEDLEEELNPKIFYRANRQFVINRNAIKSIKSYFNGKLIVQIEPKHSERIVVSKTKATAFKKWVND